MKKRGWFNESYRHYLAAKGIKTRMYFIRKRKKGAPRGPKQRKPGTIVNPLVPGSRRSESIRRALATRSPEEFLKKGVVDRLPPDKKAEFYEKKKRLEEVRDELADIEKDPEFLNIKKQIAELQNSLIKTGQKRADLVEFKKMLQSEGDPERRAFLKERIQQLEDEIEDADAANSGKLSKIGELKERIRDEVERARELRKERKELLDRLDVLQGVGGRKVVNPEFLTNEQLRARIPGIDTEGASREQLIALVLKYNPPLRPREQILPVMSKLRSESIKKLESAQKTGLRVSPPASETLSTVRKPTSKVPEEKNLREPVERAVERAKERRERQLEGLAAARETRMLRSAAGKVEREEAAAKKEEEQLRKEGMVPLKGGEE